MNLSHTNIYWELHQHHRHVEFESEKYQIIDRHHMFANLRVFQHCRAVVSVFAAWADDANFLMKRILISVCAFLPSREKHQTNSVKSGNEALFTLKSRVVIQRWIAPIKSWYITRPSTRLCTDARRVDWNFLLTHFPSSQTLPGKLRKKFRLRRQCGAECSFYYGGGGGRL